MKKLSLSWIGLLAFSLLVASCSQDDDNTPIVITNVVKQPIKITAYEYTDGASTPSITRIAQFKYNTDNSIAEMNDNGRILKFVYNSNAQLTEVNHYANETSSTIIFSEKITYEADKAVYTEQGNGLSRDHNIFINTSARTVRIIDAIVANPLYSEILFNFDSRGNIKDYEYLRKANGVEEPVFTENLTYDNKPGVFSKVKLSIPWAVLSFWSANLWDIELRQANNVTSSQTSENAFTEYAYDYDINGYPIRAKVAGKVIYEFEYKTVTP